MAQATIKYFQYVIGQGRSRQPRSPIPGAYPPGLGPVLCYAQQPPNTYVPGTAFTAPYPIPPAGLYCISNYMFGFQSVTGLVEGGQISSNILAPCSGTVGAADIIVTNVYVPSGGTGPQGENGAIIDAFNAETGEFCDDTFVTVSPDETGNLTTSGNVLGWVNSEANNETIIAFGHITPSNVYFQKWEIVEGTGDGTDSASGSSLTVGINTNPYAFAFYHNQKALFKEFKDFKEIEKPHILDNPVKDLGAEIPKLKDSEGDPWGYLNVIDPALRASLKIFTDKLSALEKQVKELGQSFIRIQERPDVGKKLGQGGDRG